mgnify:CR=1 FL=1
MAKQLYDYWFVQFDFPDENGKPYKSSGGKMVWNEKLKREIPVHWKVGEVRDFLRIFTGKKDVSKTIPGTYKFFSCAPESITSNEYIYDGAAVLVSGNGSYTGRVSYYKGKFDLYQRTYACVPIKDDDEVVFFYYTLRYLFQPVFTGGKHGSSIPYIVLGDLAHFSFAYNEEEIRKFVQSVSPMFDLQFGCRKEDLTKLRDSLLPLLMNGQVSVNYDLESIISQLHDVKKANFANHRGRQVTKFVYICAEENSTHEKGSGRWEKSRRLLSRNSAVFRHSGGVFAHGRPPKLGSHGRCPPLPSDSGV